MPLFKSTSAIEFLEKENKLLLEQRNIAQDHAQMLHGRLYKYEMSPISKSKEELVNALTSAHEVISEQKQQLGQSLTRDDIQNLFRELRKEHVFANCTTGELALDLFLKFLDDKKQLSQGLPENDSSINPISPFSKSMPSLNSKMSRQ